MNNKLMPQPDYDVTGLPYLILTFPVVDERPETHHLLYRRQALMPNHIRRGIHNQQEPLKPSQLSMRELGGAVARMCLTQTLPHDVHLRVHRELGEPKLPRTTDAQFTTMALALSRVASRYAIDVRRRADDLLVPMKPSTFWRLTSPDSLHHEASSNDPTSRYKFTFFQEFVVRYALEQQVDVPAGHIEEFLETTNGQRKNMIGRAVIDAGLETRMPALMLLYARCQRDGLHAEDSVDVRTAVRSIVPGTIEPYFPAIADRLLTLVV